MKIALDYDDTYTKAPYAWDEFIELFDSYGHDIRIVTHRHPELDKIGSAPCPIIYTNGVAKKFFCEFHANWTPDIWVDDRPETILNNSTSSQEWLTEWRATREG